MPTPITTNRSITPSQSLPDLPYQDPIAGLVRRGQDGSLRALQVWADLARQLQLFPGQGGTGTGLHHFAADLVTERFERLLVAQREVVAELVATQRHLTQQVLAARHCALPAHTSATKGHVGTEPPDGYPSTKAHPQPGGD